MSNHVIKKRTRTKEGEKRNKKKRILHEYVHLEQLNMDIMRVYFCFSQYSCFEKKSATHTNTHKIRNYLVYTLRQCTTGLYWIEEKKTNNNFKLKHKRTDWQRIDKEKENTTSDQQVYDRWISFIFFMVSILLVRCAWYIHDSYF